MKILVAEPGYSSKMKEPLDENGKYPRHYHVYVFETKLIPYLFSKAYHWYDMRIPLKIPGYRRFIQWYVKVTGAEMREFQPTGDPDFPPPRWRDRLVGWEYKQDMRCFDLSHHGRKIDRRVCLDLTTEQYLKVRNKGDKE